MCNNNILSPPDQQQTEASSTTADPEMALQSGQAAAPIKGEDTGHVTCGTEDAPITDNVAETSKNWKDGGHFDEAS